LRNSHDLPEAYEQLVVKCLPVPIHDSVAYHNTLEFFDALMRVPQPTADQLKYIELLSLLLERYEQEAHAVPDADPIAVLKHLMEEHGWSASDLGRELGDRSLGSRLLNGQRELSKAHIRTLSERFGVNPATLL